MATFIEIQTDSFAENLDRVARVGTANRGTNGVRRPLRGIEIKEDTYAVIKVIRADGTEIPLVDAGGENGPSSGGTSHAGSEVSQTVPKNTKTTTYNYTNFLIQRTDESRAEKAQIMETFGESYVFFYGERPRTVTFTGVLINSHDFNWRTEFWYNYENYLRGTKLVEQGARLYLQYDDMLIEGYILDANARNDADLPYHVPFTFTMFVTNHTYLSQVGSEKYPSHSAINVAPLDQSIDAQRTGGQSTKESRQIALNAKITELAALNKASLTPNRFNVGKNIVANALLVGLTANTTSFLNIAARFFKNRRVRFPRGIAGSDSYVGEATFASFAQKVPSQNGSPATRTNIRDNKDEYIGGDGAGAVSDDTVRAATAPNEYANITDLETEALQILHTMGINPIQHGDSNDLSPFGRTHQIVKTSGFPSSTEAFEIATATGFVL